ncbi:MAG: Glycosyl transferase family 2 [Berkelbacteria bacterium GW2011_GWA1_36_9]|uniref:Glycosyl transferase family 2 n=1 Tax=Berkelbacteria bacterium GW2011_GWA1_36_9 TaxID=1618331 RepID=A0A0G0FY55_9BACT|nr:MAG: Glycosyl transferase family 2 [Berkelbacteria bacterium GW2011_GWA1_36_9]
MKMKLSIIIPVFNEEKNIKTVISQVKNVPVEMEKEIIIVDDGSKDKTRIILQSYNKDLSIKIILQPKNLGKGSAIRRGLEEATGDFVLIQDADREYLVSDYSKILKPFLAQKAQVVYGSRFLGNISGMRWQNRLANKILTATTNLLYGTRITDEATAYKAFRRDFIQKIPLKCQRFEFCPEVTAKIAKKGFKIYEVPITYHGRSSKDGKKIKLKDAFEAFWTLVKYRFKD